jgi:predicted O-methyltransferase YrrM
MEPQFPRPLPGFDIPPLVPQSIPPRNIPPYWERKHFLSFLIDHFDWKLGAEIGVADGGTSAHLLSKHPELHMIGVDARRVFFDHAGPDDFISWDHDALRQLAEFNLAPFKDRWAMFETLSVEAAERVPDASLDFVFIDADHSEGACRADIIAWLPKVRARGWLLGHDINWKGVRAAVDDLYPGYHIGPDVVWFRPVHPVVNWWWWLYV